MNLPRRVQNYIAQRPDRSSSRRKQRRLIVIMFATIVGLLSATNGCDRTPQGLTTGNCQAWGSRGVDNGRFIKPRALTIDNQAHLYCVDMTGRIQVFEQDGKFLRCWRTPAIKDGKPCGLSISNDGLVMVADTHYFRILFYTPEGALVPERTLGGVHGRGPGEFGFVTDVVQDSRGNYYVSDYGDYDRIHKFDAAGNYSFSWGGHGSELGHFLRPQGLAVDEQDRLWVADACNHRVQVFDAVGDQAKLLFSWGEMGEAAGQLRYPYNIALAKDGTVWIVEFGNHRIQQFTRQGESLAVFGGPGRALGQFQQPWALALSESRVFVLDSYNHRVQALFR